MGRSTERDGGPSGRHGHEIIMEVLSPGTRLVTCSKRSPGDVRMPSVRPDVRAASAARAARRTPALQDVEGTARASRRCGTSRRPVCRPPLRRVDPQSLKTTPQGEIAFELSFLYYPRVEDAPREAGADVEAAPDPPEPDDALSPDPSAASAEPALPVNGRAALAEGDPAAEAALAPSEPTPEENLAARPRRASPPRSRRASPRR